LSGRQSNVTRRDRRWTVYGKAYTMGDRLLTTKQVAERMGEVSESTVRYWRHIGYGPPGFRVGRRVMYPETDLEQWIRGLRDAQATPA
jgi:predicted DNA-binding transcriptional regulator AlpA